VEVCWPKGVEGGAEAPKAGAAGLAPNGVPNALALDAAPKAPAIQERVKAEAKEGLKGERVLVPPNSDACCGCC
jgi:hypothetical protein